MNEWNTYQDEHALEQRRHLEELWRALDEQDELPEPQVLKSLSGLLDVDIERFQLHWADLALKHRRALVQALGDLADQDFKMDFSAVFRVTLQDPDGEVRAVSIRGLREVEDIMLVPTLTQLLRHDVAAAARAAAAAALGDYVLLGELGKTRPEPFEAAVAALRESLQDETEVVEVHQQAIAAIAYTEEEWITAFIQEAYEHADAAMRISAIIAMGHSANPRWQRLIIRELSSANPTMRFHATRAAGELQLRDAVEDVARLTDDVDQKVRLMALWALGQIGGPVSRRTLDGFLESEDPEMQRTAKEALQELEFFYGDTSSFFGPPSDFSGDAEEPWAFTDLLDNAIEDADDDEWD